MPIDAGDALVEALHNHNLWWDQGTDIFDLPTRQKSDFYHLARPEQQGSQFEDQSILALVGRRGVGKTTLLHPFIQHRITDGATPEQFLYLPFDANPLYQLQSDEQLRRAVRYYESRIHGRTADNSPHFMSSTISTKSNTTTNQQPMDEEPQSHPCSKTHQAVISS
jgi:hypothetical protein